MKITKSRLMAVLQSAALLMGITAGAASLIAAEKTYGGTQPGIRFYKDSPHPQAVVLSLNGSAEYSTNNDSYSKLRVGDVLDEGASIKTGKDSRVDLFFRRMAVTIRVTSNAEIKLEKMAKYNEPNVISPYTVIDLRAGQLFCFVRGVVPNSKFEVKHSGTRAVVEGEGVGGFEVQADRATVAPRKSFIPLKIVSEAGVAVVAPGQKYDLKRREAMDLASTEIEETMIHFDELQALTDLLSAEEVVAKNAGQ